MRVGSDDKTVRLWEVQTGRCMQTIELEDKVKSVAWCPNSSLSLAAVAWYEYTTNLIACMQE